MKLILLFLGLFFQLPALAVIAQTEAIEVRIEKAKNIFLAEVINRFEKDGWVRAELLVKETVFGVEKGEKVKVIWSKPSHDPLITDDVTFDVAEGDMGVALLGDQHEGRFWLRDDKFEPVTEFDSIKKLATPRAINPAFSKNLYQQLCKEEGNVFFSPYSISEAMGMVYAGSGGNTAKEIAKALSFGEDPKTLGPKMQELRSHLMSQVNIKDDKLNIANALFVSGEKPLQSYQDTVRQQYDGEVFTGGLDPINAWVNKKTEGKIEKILDELSPNSVCVLLNAVYFKGNWKTTFDTKATHKADFHLPSGKDTKVDMMTRLDKFKLLRNQGLIALELPYQTSASMVLIMPEKAEGMKDLESKLNHAMIEGLCKKLQGNQYEEVHLFLPKFKIATSYDLIEPLNKLGMVDAFNEKADFKAMYGDFPVSISQIKHEATLEVDEKGTVATAATAVEMQKNSLPSEIRFNRPFLVLIRENTSGTNIFMGRINDPTAD